MSTPKEEKKKYESPKLSVFGNVATITEGGLMNKAMDNAKLFDRTG